MMGSTRQDQSELASAVRALEGARLVEVRRTLNIAIVGLLRGDEEVRLHAQCPLRIGVGDRLLMASGDMRYPLSGAGDRAEAFDSYRTNYDRFAEQVTARFAAHDFDIMRAELGRGGKITLEAVDDFWIEVAPDVSGPIECWRLFVKDSDEHFVYQAR
ncbi:hypothetical protein [Actinoplanes sp. NPDC026619]|uniref:hypothetical protein n=1 Tax=Actinoplanes sp. NPDC026619 TaxID=3155798 RepID=UPI0033C9EB78